MSEPSITLKTILETTNGSLEPGDARTGDAVAGICSLEDPADGAISFLTSDALNKLPEEAKRCNLAGLIVRKDISRDLESPLPYPLILVEHPLKAMAEVSQLFFPPCKVTSGIHELASVHPEATVAPDASIAPFCTVAEGAVIESGVVLHPHVTLYPHCRVGKNTVIHSHSVIRERCQVGANSVIQNGAVIGADGFGYFPDPQHGLQRVPQVGIVELADGVDVGANACIDRATLGKTSIGQGTKIDNLVQVGHNVVIGMYSILCALTGVGGSTKIGNQVTLGGHTGVADHIRIVDGARFGGKSGITRSIKEKGDYIGFPSFPAVKWRRQIASLALLPEFIREMKALKKGKD